MEILEGLFSYRHGIIAVVAAYPIYVLFRRLTAKKRGRSMSFNSSAMIAGNFPPNSGVCPPIISAALLFQKCPEMDVLKEEAWRGLSYYDRFRFVPIYDDVRGDWIFEDKNSFRDDSLFSEITVANEAELLQELDRTSMEDLTGYGKTPAWHMRIVHNSGNGLSAVVVKIHHIIGDGISLVTAIGKVFTNADGTCVPLDLPLNSSKKDGPAPKGNNLLSLILEAVVCFFKVLGNAASKYDSDILFTSQNKPALKMAGTKRKAVFFPTTKLDFLKKVKNKANVTINDVLLAATSGAIRRYCEKRGDPLIGPGKTSVNRALLPVAFPRSDKELQNPSIAMRNKWACVSSELPIDKLTCAERIEASSKSMTFLKKSPMAYVQLWVQTNLLPLLPRFLSQNTALDLFKRHSMVFSNLPGPTNHYYFGRQKVVGFQVLFPNIIPQVILMSYVDGVFMNMIVDDEIVKDSDLLADLFRVEMKELATQYGLSNEEKDIFLPVTHDGAVLSAADSESQCCSNS